MSAQGDADAGVGGWGMERREQLLALSSHAHAGPAVFISQATQQPTPPILQPATVCTHHGSVQGTGQRRRPAAAQRPLGPGGGAPPGHGCSPRHCPGRRGPAPPHQGQCGGRWGPGSLLRAPKEPIQGPSRAWGPLGGPPWLWWRPHCRSPAPCGRWLPRSCAALKRPCAAACPAGRGAAGAGAGPRRRLPAVSVAVDT